MTQDEPPQDQDRVLARLAMYRALQDSVPGLDALYRLVPALIAGQVGHQRHVLIVGAGGGREIEEIAKAGLACQILAVDPSEQNLDLARSVAKAADVSEDVRFIVGTPEDVPRDQSFDAATSLMVMHHLADDGAKLTYLRRIRDALVPGGLLIHADVCFDTPEEFTLLVPAYQAHAARVGADANAIRLECEAVPKLPVVPVARMRALFDEAGFSPPQDVFRSLWYRCWITTRRG